MKKIIYIFIMIILLITGCSDDMQTKDTTKKEVEIEEKEINLVKTKEFIDVDNETINFLFKTNIGSTVDIYIGESKNDLKLAKTIKNYDYNDGYYVKGFKPGNDYFYQIVSSNSTYKQKSEINSLKKLSRNVNIENASWGRSAIFYEIFVRSFYDTNKDGIGDFNGLTEKLDYIENLGVTAIWLMPTTDSPSYHGYDTRDYKKVNEDYGTLNDFEMFLEEAHKRDIKVIMDLVVNHTSAEHKWFKAAINGDKKYKDYYVWSDIFDNIGETGEWGQKIWHSHGTDGFYMGIFWDQMPDLNLRNPNVRKEIKEISNFWLDLGVDGFRLDASKHIDDKNVEVTHLWWQEFNSFIKKVNSEVFIVGENWDSNINVIAPYFKDMDSSFNFAISEDIIETVNGRHYGNIIEEQLKMHEKFGKINKDFVDATFIRNHDMSRTMSEVFGNINKVKLAASIQLTMPGTPFIYYGEELGQKGKKPDDNIREPFDWYRSADGDGMTKMNTKFYHSIKYTKENDGISLEEEINDKDSIYNHYKKLIEFRKNNTQLFYGEFSIMELGDKILAYKIKNETEYIYVIHNLSKNENEVFLIEIIGNERKEQLHNYDLKEKFILKPRESIIIK